MMRKDLTRKAERLGRGKPVNRPLAAAEIVAVGRRNNERWREAPMKLAAKKPLRCAICIDREWLEQEFNSFMLEAAGLDQESGLRGRGILRLETCQRRTAIG